MFWAIFIVQLFYELFIHLSSCHKMFVVIKSILCTKLGKINVTLTKYQNAEKIDLQ